MLKTLSPPSSSPSHQATTPTDLVHSSSLSQTTAGTQAAPKPKVTPKQDELNKDINIENEILVSLYRKRDLEQASESDRKEILTRKATLKRLKKELKEVIQNATRQKKLRDERKRKLESMDETTRKKLMGKATSDLGRLEKCDKSELIKAIYRIAISGSATHDQRRNEVRRAVKTLDQLTEALNREGFELKRSSVYLHLLLRNHRSIERKRHVTTAPFKLYKSQNSKHASHPSTKFARASIRSLEEIAAILGPAEVTFHSQDGKAKVPIGLTAANKQAPMLMHMEYQVTLPDHDFVVAPKHSLIPSVIGDMKLVNSKDLTNDAVTYSGATYIGIRSAKHSASSAFAHFQDMMRVRSLPEFARSFQTDRHEEKKVMIVTVDGDPEENPRYEKAINCSIKYFVENGLDAFFLATNAPGRSALVKLSKELSGVILEHDKFGSHLDANGVTVDKYLELKNFEYAGRTLAEIWSGLVIDGSPVVTEFIEDDAPVIMGTKSEEWKACHVRQSQYFLQIVKCANPKCCLSFQSSCLKVAPKTFLPPPLPVFHTRNGIEWAKDDKDATYLSLYQNISLQNALMPAQATKKFPKGIPCDYSCPFVDQDMIKRRMCSHCGLYSSSLKAKSLHEASCRVTEGRIENTTERVRPLRVVVRRQKELLCVMVFQEMEWASMDAADAEDFDLSNITDDENENEFGTPVFDTDEVVPIWSDEIED